MIWKCTTSGGCIQQSGSSVIFNWNSRWIHTASGASCTISGSGIDKTLCPNWRPVPRIALSRASTRRPLGSPPQAAPWHCGNTSTVLTRHLASISSGTMATTLRSNSAAKSLHSMSIFRRCCVARTACYTSQRWIRPAAGTSITLGALTTVRATAMRSAMSGRGETGPIFDRSCQNIFFKNHLPNSQTAVLELISNTLKVLSARSTWLQPPVGTGYSKTSSLDRYLDRYLASEITFAKSCDKLLIAKSVWEYRALFCMDAPDCRQTRIHTVMGVLLERVLPPGTNP